MTRMYFVAVVAPGEINEQVVKWKQFVKERFNCVVALRSPAHVTLIPPFWMEDSLEKELEAAVTNFSLRQTNFELHLKNFGAFKPRVIYVHVITNEFLEKLHAQLQDFLMEGNLFPLEKDARPYHPHVTIATRDLHKRSFHEAWEIFKEEKYEAAWLATSISILRHNQKNWDVIFTSQFQN